MITLKFFAALADSTGVRERSLDFRPTPFQLINQVPELAGYGERAQLRVAVNHAWADWDTSLHDGDEVAFLPPLGGG